MNASYWILAFDVGIKNLSYCLLESHEKDTHIIQWDNLCITDEKCKTVPLERMTEMTLLTLQDTFANNPNFQVDVVLIENQPSQKNGIMKTISVIIYTFFNMLKIQMGNVKEVRFVSPSSKLKCKWVNRLSNPVSTTYSQRKKLSVQLMKLYMEVICPERIPWFQQHRKQDDISDSALFGIYYIENTLKRVIPIPSVDDGLQQPEPY